MTPRKKVTAEPILQNDNQMDDAIREWHELDSQVDAIAQAQQEKIDEVKAQFEAQAEPIIARKLRLEKDMEDYALYHKNTKFEKVRSVKLTYGKYGFRVSTQLKYLSGWTAKKVLAKLKELGRVEFIKTTESVKKAEIRQANLPAQVMRGFGCYIDEKDEFYFEPDKSAIANARGKMEAASKAA